ncbi:hypothetical protein DC3_41150 [Deinococcus cellulosilyticus NBRC 106333 = KACC 11606]|uniref:Uncharacterized protein n=1 Tax=Deinococcus cellulosilyticus (strain DSM 18568 / NBRC 106333 / KACC 11606 / 5516J-15) TaxID=1223518 RepID=A0A511N6J4_DEIC1|nr:hypothetical protein DC3_41150 [Deinococcus cellulosilyticus NBRC 106333 = KACC 11606]
MGGLQGALQNGFPESLIDLQVQGDVQRAVQVGKNTGGQHWYSSKNKKWLLKQDHHARILEPIRMGCAGFV